MQTKIVVRPLTLVQKGAIDVINNSSYYSYTGPIFKKLRNLKKHDLFDYQSILFVQQSSPFYYDIIRMLWDVKILDVLNVILI